MVDDVLVKQQGAVLEIRMNRPAKKNALTQDMYGAMADALQNGDQDDGTRAILITAEGDMFTAGNDLSDFEAISRGERMEKRGNPGRFLEMLATIETPLIAAASGSGVGIGTTMLLHCDVVIAAEDAQFTTPFTSLGVTPEAGSSLLLPAHVGYKKAYAMLALGQPMTGKEAVAIGLASEALPRDRVEQRAREVAEVCAARPAEAMRITKRLLRDKEAIRARIREEQRNFEERLRSPEAQAAFQAFFKR